MGVAVGHIRRDLPPRISPCFPARVRHSNPSHKTQPNTLLRMGIENGPDESSGLEGLRSSSTSGAKQPKQPKPIRTAQADATQQNWHSQEHSQPRRRARGEERRGGGNREGRTEGEDYHKEAAINAARPKRAGNETRNPQNGSKSGVCLISKRRRNAVQVQAGHLQCALIGVFRGAPPEEGRSGGPEGEGSGACGVSGEKGRLRRWIAA